MSKKYFITSIFLPLLLLCNINLMGQHISTCAFHENELAINECLYQNIILENYNKSFDADRIIDRILEPIGIEKNFIISKCNNISNCLAVTSPISGDRFILYDKKFLSKINFDSGSSWAEISILAHEIGHHLQGHTIKSSTDYEKRQQELEADKFSGFVLAKLGASLSQAQAAMQNLFDPLVITTHPPKRKRLEAIASGFRDAEQQQSKLKQSLVTTVKSDQRYELFSSSQKHISESNYIAAIDDLSLAIRLKDDFIQGYLSRAFCHMMVNDYEKALEDFLVAEKKAAPNDGVLSDIALCYFYKNDFENALIYFQKSLDINELNSTALYSLGFCYRSLNKNEEGIKALTKAINLQNENNIFQKNMFTEMLNVRAELFSSIGDYDSALKDTDKSISISPNMGEPYFEKARIYYEQNQLSQSLGSIKDAIKYNPERAFYREFLAAYHLELGEFESAKTELEKVLKKEPNSSWGNLLYARYLLESPNINGSRLNEALYISTKIIKEVDATSWEANYTKGMANFLIGNIKDAVIDFQHAIEYNMSITISLNNSNNRYTNIHLVRMMQMQAKCYKELGDIKNYKSNFKFLCDTFKIQEACQEYAND